MKNFKKTLALLAALALSATALYGCGEDKQSSTATNDSKVEDSKTEDSNTGSEDSNTGSEDPNTGSEDGESPLTILCWNANDSKPMVDLFCEKTGTDPSKIVIQNFDVKGEEAAETYTQYLSKEENDADIMFLEADWCLQFINDDSYTLPLSTLGYSESDFSDIYGYVVETGKSTTTKELKGISWQAAAGGYCYREDLAEEFLGVKTPEEMQEKVKDWDAFLATAKELKEKNGPAISATLGGVWQVYSGSRSTAWVDADNKLVVDDYCTKYAEFAHELWKNEYVTHATQWTAEWKPLGTSGDTLGYFVSTWGFGPTILEEAAGGDSEGNTMGKWKCIVGPSEFYWGGTWLAPSARINNKELAKEFIDFFTINEEGARAYAEKQGEYMSNKKVMEAIIADGKYEGAPVLGGQNQFVVLNEVANNIDMNGKITPYDAVIKSEFSNAVNEYCDGTVDSVEEAMNNFKTNAAAKLGDEVIVE